jgi:hypothetical protein
MGPATQGLGTQGEGMEAEKGAVWAEASTLMLISTNQQDPSRSWLQEVRHQSLRLPTKPIKQRTHCCECVRQQYHHLCQPETSSRAFLQVNDEGILDEGSGRFELDPRDRSQLGHPKWYTATHSAALCKIHCQKI